MQEQFIFVEQLNINIGAAKILENLNFSIGRGECVAIVGANGSGKTTLIKALCGLAKVSTGTLRIAGLEYRAPQQALKLRLLIGYAPDTPPLYSQDTIYTYLQFIAKLRCLTKNEMKQQIDHCLEICNLTNYTKESIRTLSKGTQQRINLAQALLHAPEILILDEPTNALDPQEADNFCQHLLQLQAAGVTIIIASHLYNDLIPVCSYMLKVQNKNVSKISAPLLTQKSTQHHEQWDYST